MRIYIALLFALFSLLVPAVQASQVVTSDDIASFWSLAAKFEHRYDMHQCRHWIRYITDNRKFCMTATCYEAGMRQPVLTTRIVTYGSWLTTWGVFWTNAATLTVEDMEWCKG